MQLDDFQYVPDELKSRKQWLTWRFEPGAKKPLKVPYYANGAKRFGAQGDEKDRGKLATFDAALSAATARGFDGIGFAFLPGDGLIGIDIDKCVDEDGVMSDLANEVLGMCPSYVERSPSGTGFHIIMSGETVTFKSNHVGLEIFCGSQFFTFTGRTLESEMINVAPISDAALARLRVLVRGPDIARPKAAPSLPVSGVDRVRMESALSHISADDYHQWINVGMAIHGTLGESGFRLWDYWSSRSEKYDEAECVKRWKSFGKREGVTDATIYKLAIQGGWKPPRNHQPVPPLRGALATPPVESPRAPLDGAAGGVNESPDPPPEFDAALPADSPAHPPDGWVERKVSSVIKPTLESLIQHFALIYGSTDVWDGLTKQRIKKPAFVMLVGKDLAREWLEHASRRSIDPDSLPLLKRGRAVAGGGGDRLDEVLERITLLYGTVTVWDKEKRMVMTLDAMRAAFGTDVVKRWQEHTLRDMKDADKLVFDPTQSVDLGTHINMFAGYPLVPTPNNEKVRPVLDLLNELCGHEENAPKIVDWLLKWLAYPLQHPGAKMQTAVLMFGEKQGTGKSLFFEGIMRPIYGEYGSTAGQHQLDSSFTDWKSRKCYMVFEEVLSRDDRYSHIGTLKHMVTGREIRINPKNLPERVEQNYLNSVFLSNEPQPIPLELEDRRWLVIEARNKLAEDFTDRMKALMKQGLSEAFYAYLLAYPLGNFDEHTKPLMTEAKRKIIRFGRPGWDAFHESWKEGALRAPYVSCLSEDLYEVYKRWCERNQERKLTLTKFSELLSGREVKKKKWVNVGFQKASRMCFLLEQDDEDALNENIQKFRDGADLNLKD